MSESMMIPASDKIVAGDGAASRTINLGFTPAWVLVLKREAVNLYV